MLRNASAMIAEREALRMGIEHLTVLFPTEVSSFDFQVESTGWTVQYKLNAQSLRLFDLHRDVNDAHRAGANRLKNNKQISKDTVENYKSIFESRISAGLQKKCQKQRQRRNLMPKQYLHGPMTWKVMQRNAWTIIANLRTKQLIIYTKSQRHAWMIINLKKKKWISWRIIYCLLSNCSEMSILGTYWKA